MPVMCSVLAGEISWRGRMSEQMHTTGAWKIFLLLDRYAAAKKLCENFPGATIYLTTKSEKVTPQVKKGT